MTILPLPPLPHPSILQLTSRVSYFNLDSSRLKKPTRVWNLVKLQSQQILTSIFRQKQTNKQKSSSTKAFEDELYGHTIKQKTDCRGPIALPLIRPMSETVPQVGTSRPTDRLRPQTTAVTGPGIHGDSREGQTSTRTLGLWEEDVYP